MERSAQERLPRTSECVTMLSVYYAPKRSEATTTMAAISSRPSEDQPAQARLSKSSEELHLPPVVLTNITSTFFLCLIGEDNADANADSFSSSGSYLRPKDRKSDVPRSSLKPPSSDRSLVAYPGRQRDSRGIGPVERPGGRTPWHVPTGSTRGW